MVSGKSISESKSGNHSRNRQTCDTHIINPMSNKQSKTKRGGCSQCQKSLFLNWCCELLCNSEQRPTLLIITDMIKHMLMTF